jgi:hypothetical protein
MILASLSSLSLSTHREVERESWAGGQKRSRRRVAVDSRLRELERIRGVC